MLLVTIPFAQVKTFNPNIDPRFTSTEFDVYLKNIIVCFASLRKFNTSLELQLVTNINVKEPFESILKDLNVEITLIPFTFEPPVQLGLRFKACFFILDCIKDMKKSTLFIDPDVICMNPIQMDQFRLGESQGSIGVLNMKFSKDFEVNGISHAEAVAIYKGITRRDSRFGFHVGGEAFFLPLQTKEDFLERILSYWIESLKITDSKILPTEEHIFSVIVKDFRTFELNKTILRIWTAKSYRGSEGGRFDLQLPLWHMPAEKTRGILKIYELLVDKNDRLNQSIFDDKQLIAKLLHLDKIWLRNLLSTCILFIKRFI